MLNCFISNIAKVQLNKTHFVQHTFSFKESIPRSLIVKIRFTPYVVYQPLSRTWPLSLILGKRQTCIVFGMPSMEENSIIVR